MAEMDVFDSDWEHLSAHQVPLGVVSLFDTVPLSNGNIAMLVTTIHPESRVQAMVSPDHALKMAALLVATVNRVRKKD